MQMTDLTDEQRANLAQLSAYLWTLPADYPDFEMSSYITGAGGSGHNRACKPKCGTAACAAGHGPVAGIKPKRGETWADYSHRAFIPDDSWDWEANAWEWVFGGGWSNCDNTVHGAAARIDDLLERGCPPRTWGRRAEKARFVRGYQARARKRRSA